VLLVWLAAASSSTGLFFLRCAALQTSELLCTHMPGVLPYMQSCMPQSSLNSHKHACRNICSHTLYPVGVRKLYWQEFGTLLFQVVAFPAHLRPVCSQSPATFNRLLCLHTLAWQPHGCVPYTGGQGQHGPGRHSRLCGRACLWRGAECLHVVVPCLAVAPSGSLHTSTAAS
jgi:hypothetical protein